MNTRFQTRCVRLSVLLQCAFLYAIAAALMGVTAVPLQAQDIASYQRPKADAGFIQADRIALSSIQRKELADQIAGLVRSETWGEPENRFVYYARALGIALALDPGNRTAFIADELLSRGRIPPRSDDFKTRENLVLLLNAAIKGLKLSGKAADLTAAAYLTYVVTIIDPSDDNAMFEYLTYTGDKALDWSWAGTALPSASEKAETSFAPPLADVSRMEKPVGAKLNQAKIKGLVVSQITDGSYIGQTIDIIGTAPSGKGGRQGYVGFVRTVGDEMKTSLEEARRTVEAHYPNWSKYYIEISFGDKYTPKDGGSAGAAFGVLVEAMIEGYAIDPDFAMTGDITVEGKIREVGAVGAKVHGAVLDGCKVVAVPALTVGQLDDMYILYPKDAIWQIQVFSIETLDQAIQLSWKERPERIAQAIELFAEVQTKAALGGKTPFYQLPDVQEQLNKVLELAPNHESARFLLRLAAGDVPRRLTPGMSLTRISLACNRFEPVFDEDSDTDVDQIVKEVKRDLSNIQVFLAPDVKALCSELIDLMQAIAKHRGLVRKFKEWAEASTWSNTESGVSRQKAMIDAYRKKIDDAGKQMKKEADDVAKVRKKLGSDYDFIQKMIRE